MDQGAAARLEATRLRMQDVMEPTQALPRVEASVPTPQIAGVSVSESVAEGVEAWWRRAPLAAPCGFSVP